MAKEIRIVGGIPFEVVKHGTKMARKVINAQLEGTEELDVYKIYGRPSRTKEAIALWWKDRINKINGYNIRIPSQNKMQFSIAFALDTKLDGKDVTIFFYITKEHNRGYILERKGKKA